MTRGRGAAHPLAGAVDKAINGLGWTDEDGEFDKGKLGESL
ncbi:hypothetical protein [Streptomyces mesophilus]|nr:hypothetical protein [Streptomyces mesophilus]